MTTQPRSPLTMLLSRHTRRRDFITLLGGAAAWPLAARGHQPERMRRIGVLIGAIETDPESQARIAAFKEGLQALGWTDGRNVHIDYRFASADLDLTHKYAAELVGLAPEVILANSPLVLRALRQQTSTIPIVFALVVDPVGEGFIKSLAQPGGNITGFTSFEYPLSGKWLEVLKEIAPSIRRIGAINQAENVTGAGYLRALESAALTMGVQLIAAHVRDAAEIEGAITAMASQSNGGLIILPSPLALVNREMIVKLAAKHRLPAVYPFRYFVSSGGLMSYGADTVEIFRRSALYVDRILKGEKPAALPVQQPTKFELVLNLKAAKALGLDVPWFLQQRADEVIE
jgi:putative tryptophan/tyrosine transport system substrate-binding protein